MLPNEVYSHMKYSNCLPGARLATDKGEYVLSLDGLQIVCTFYPRSIRCEQAEAEARKRNTYVHLVAPDYYQWMKEDSIDKKRDVSLRNVPTTGKWDMYVTHEC